MRQPLFAKNNKQLTTNSLQHKIRMILKAKLRRTLHLHLTVAQYVNFQILTA